MSDTYNINQFNADPGVDSTGAPLPTNFNSYERTTTYTYSVTLPSAYDTVTEVVVVGADTYTRITQYTDDSTNVTSVVVGQWVKS